MYTIFILVKNNKGDNMDRIKYKHIVDKYKSDENKIINLVISFLIGGLVGAISVGLTDLYSYILDIPSKDATTFMIVTLIIISCLFTALGFFDKWVTFAKCGLIIPITGFAHSMMSSSLEFKKEGFIYGIGSNMFKLAGSVIVYGVVSASLFGTIRYVFFGG